MWIAEAHGLGKYLPHAEKRKWNP